MTKKQSDYENIFKDIQNCDVCSEDLILSDIPREAAYIGNQYGNKTALNLLFIGMNPNADIDTKKRYKKLEHVIESFPKFESYPQYLKSFVKMSEEQENSIFFNEFGILNIYKSIYPNAVDSKIPKDIAFMNLANCYNRNSESIQEIIQNCCLHFLAETIENLDPDIVICLGNEAYTAFCQLNNINSIHKSELSSIFLWRYPYDQENRIRASIFFYHPSYAKPNDFNSILDGIIQKGKFDKPRLSRLGSSYSFELQCELLQVLTKIIKK